MRIGTRRSALALAQAELVARSLPGPVQIVEIVTDGDRGSGPGDKSRWVAELELALSEERVDLAVHSAKDVPAELAAGTALLGAPARAPAEDVLCGAAGVEGLREGARVGTSSLRRIAQLRAAREDIEVLPLRGNVDTRLAKLAAGEQDLDAIVLARAGLTRLGRESEATSSLDATRFVPAPGQGALALQGRADDERVAGAARSITHEETFACLRAERALAAALGADCDTPLGAHAVASGGGLRLHAWVGLPDGSAWASDELEGELADPVALGASRRRPPARGRRTGAARRRARDGRGRRAGGWPLRERAGGSSSSARDRATPGCSARERSS